MNFALPRTLLLFPLALFMFLATSNAAHAKMDEASLKQGIHHTSLGALTVIAIQDRPGEMDISLFSGPASEETRKAFIPTGKAPASYNAFVIKNGDNITLVDTGWGTASPDGSAFLLRLASLGIAPEAVKTVLLTHMHLDHMGGLVNAQKPVFPNAVVLVSQPEADYWLSEENQQLAKDGKRPNALLALNIKNAYGNAFIPFTPGATVAPGILAVPTPGHTPGHTAYLIESNGAKLFIIGDLLHTAALQFAYPDESAKYDMDPAQAAKSRKALLTRALNEKILIAGMHLPFPATGKVKTWTAPSMGKTPKNPPSPEQFRFVPVNK